MYDEEKEEGACVDINECNAGTDRCDENALCFNEMGTYQCRCKVGYHGDGFTCQSMLSSFKIITFYFNFKSLQRRRRVQECVVRLIRDATKHLPVILNAAAFPVIKTLIINADPSLQLKLIADKITDVTSTPSASTLVRWIITDANVWQDSKAMVSTAHEFQVVLFHNYLINHLKKTH